jgi:hypothetical protein
MGEIVDVQIAIEWGGTEIVIDGKIYTLWNLESFNKYLSMLTGLKRKEFFDWINDINGKINCLLAI